MPKPQLTALIATALASLTVAFTSSYFGIAGTVYGAAITAVVGSLATTYYNEFLSRSARGARWFRQRDKTPTSRAAREARTAKDRERAYRLALTAAVSTICVLAAVAVSLAVIQGLAGKPVSDIVRGQHPAPAATSAPSNPAPTEAPTTAVPSMSPLPAASPTATISATPTVQPTPVASSPTVTPSASPTATAPPTVPPTAAPTPSAS